jgi:membrane fusion protein, multidrug efflux system
MKHKPAIITIGAMLVFIVVVAAVKVAQIRAAIANGKSFQPPPVAVTTTIAKRERWPDTLQAVGTVTASQGVTVSADLPGVVQSITFESGAPVRKGDLLVQLDVKEEKAQLESARSSSRLAERDLAREQSLYAQGVVPRQELDQVTSQARTTSAGVEQVAATIARKRIVAPFSGTLGIRRVNLGQYLRSGDPIVPLSVLDPIHVDFSVPQQELGRLQTGALVHATTQKSTEEVDGRISAIDAIVDEATRNVMVRATFENDDGTLRPGMFVDVQVKVDEGKPQIRLPASAINHAPYGDSVYVVEDMEGKDGATYRGVRMQFVDVGHARADEVTILSGVSQGDEVVTTGVFKLRPSAPVQIDNSVREAAPAREDVEE